MTITPKELAAKASDGMVFVNSDIQKLYESLAETDPLAAQTVLSTLRKAEEVSREINRIFLLIK